MHTMAMMLNCKAQWKIPIENVLGAAVPPLDHAHADGERDAASSAGIRYVNIFMARPQGGFAAPGQRANHQR